MPSPEALYYDSIYHIYNRGVNRQDIFFEPINYAYFLHLYTRFLTYYFDTYAYCLLKNHFHLLIRVKDEDEISALFQKNEPCHSNRKPPTPSMKISNFFNAYAKGINSRYGRTGSLFQHPFGRKIISSDTSLWAVIAYIHQNPQKHHFVRDFRDWKFSSFTSFIDDQPTILQKDLLQDLFGGKESYLQLSQQWVGDAKEKWCIDEEE